MISSILDTSKRVSAHHSSSSRRCRSCRSSAVSSVSIDGWASLHNKKNMATRTQERAISIGSAYHLEHDKPVSSGRNCSMICLVRRNSSSPRPLKRRWALVLSVVIGRYSIQSAPHTVVIGCGKSQHCPAIRFPSRFLDVVGASTRRGYQNSRMEDL